MAEKMLAKPSATYLMREVSSGHRASSEGHRTSSKVIRRHQWQSEAMRRDVLLGHVEGIGAEVGILLSHELRDCNRLEGHDDRDDEPDDWRQSQVIREVLIRGPPKWLDRDDERVDQQLPRGVLLELRPNKIWRIAELSDDSDATCRRPRRVDVPNEGGHQSSTGRQLEAVRGN